MYFSVIGVMISASGVPFASSSRCTAVEKRFQKYGSRTRAIVFSDIDAEDRKGGMLHRSLLL